MQNYKKNVNTFYNNQLQKYKNDNICNIYGATHHMYPTSLTCDIYIIHKDSSWDSMTKFWLKKLMI